ncbi:MAG: SDR family oxidoreductase [Gemmatimonadota bacterium]|nr:SDR family oxidoreductase [Gemmatimonadota bacterium]
MKVAVTGATGYIGGRLIPRLLADGYDVVAIGRDASRLRSRAWFPHVEVREADLFDLEALSQALSGVNVAYYLVHSMQSGADFADMDRRAAENFIAAGAHLEKVVYLGGIQPPGASTHESSHLGSRAQVGSLLRAALPTVELRAGPIIGSGSASFEMVRYLTERLPAMVAPKWVRNPVRPIGIRDVLSYLIAAMERSDATGVVDIGTNLLTFKEMMEVYASVRGLRRKIFPVPVLAPRLAARWVGLVTPIHNRLAVPLIEGVVRPLEGDMTRARELFPHIEPIPYREAVEYALQRVQTDSVSTRWSGASGPTPEYEMVDEEGIFREVRSLNVDAPPQRVFEAFTSLGGSRGWLVWNWAWALRGFFDGLVGGPGLRRGRRHPKELYPGEAVDFWRVETVDSPRILRLRAEMRLPGTAWLEFEARPLPEGGTELIQTARFAPRGALGVLYWYSLYPMHRWIFSDLVQAIADVATAPEPVGDHAGAPNP